MNRENKAGGLTRLTVRCLAAEQQLLSVCSTSPLSGLKRGSCTAERLERPADLHSALRPRSETPAEKAVR